MNRQRCGACEGFPGGRRSAQVTHEAFSHKLQLLLLPATACPAAVEPLLGAGAMLLQGGVSSDTILHATPAAQQPEVVAIVASRLLSMDPVPAPEQLASMLDALNSEKQDASARSAFHPP